MTLARFVCVFTLALASVVLGGCGQKGPLTLVAPQSQPPDALTGAPADEEEAPQEEEPSGNDP